METRTPENIMTEQKKNDIKPNKKGLLSRFLSLIKAVC